jgi:hypothetical protein
MDDHVPSTSALEQPRFASAATGDPAAARRELERTKRAEAARITALVQYLLHDRGEAAASD